MTGLRQKMIEALQLKGLSERTQEAYVQAVRQLAGHFITTILFGRLQSFGLRSLAQQLIVGGNRRQRARREFTPLDLCRIEWHLSRALDLFSVSARCFSCIDHISRLNSSFSCEEWWQKILRRALGDPRAFESQ